MDKFNFKKMINKTTESLKNIDINKAVSDLSEFGENAVNTVVKVSKDTVDNITDMLEKPVNNKGLLTVEDALAIYFILISSDKELNNEELNMFNLIGKELDPSFDQYKGEIINKLSNKINAIKDDIDYIDYLRDYIKDIIEHSASSKDAIVNGKLLIWNLLTIAYVDGECNEEERKLIRYITRTMEVDQTFVLELENNIQTINALEKEVQYLKQSNKAYNIVEPYMNELSDRKLAILQGTYALIKD